jgi:hypothetical protein
MVCFIQPEARFPQEPRPLNSLCLANPAAQGGRERLCHLVLGSPDGVRATINRLHLLTYAEQGHWSPLVTIPPAGILITPQQGEVFSLLRRDRPKPTL